MMAVLSLPLYGQSKADTLAIKKAALDYVEGWATGNTALSNSKGVRIPDLTPGKELEQEVRILDIDGINASAKTWNAKYGFFDYIHLSKAGGKWMIINVLWDMNGSK